MLGLKHSALGYFEVTDAEARLAAAEAVMFPFAFDPGNTAGRQLKADDVAGVAEITPKAITPPTPPPSAPMCSSTAGRVRRHVMAFNPITGLMVGGFVLENGEVTITGLQPGPYVLRLEPVDDDDVGSYFDDLPPVDVAFRNMFVDRLIYAESGTIAGPVAITLEADEPRGSLSRRLGVALLLAAAAVPGVSAQSAPDVQVRPPTVEVGGGIGWVGQAVPVPATRR